MGVLRLKFAEQTVVARRFDTMTSNSYVRDANSVLDADLTPSLDKIAANGWSTAIGPDFPTVDRVAAFCEVTRGLGLSHVRALAINGNEIECKEDLELVPDEVLKFLV